jgi:hypothetical protein
VGIEINKFGPEPSVRPDRGHGVILHVHCIILTHLGLSAKKTDAENHKEPCTSQSLFFYVKVLYTYTHIYIIYIFFLIQHDRYKIYLHLSMKLFIYYKSSIHI